MEDRLRTRMTSTTQDNDYLNPSTPLHPETGIVLQLADGSIAACNLAAQQILGTTIDQLQDASSINSLWQTIYPDGTPFPGEAHPAMVALQTGQPCLNVEMGFYKPDGNLVWIKIDAQPLFQRDASNPYAVTVTMTPLSAPTLHSIEARRQPYEQRWRVLFQSLPVGVVLVDPIAATIVEFNDAAATNLGYTCAEFARLTIADIDMRRDRQTVLQHLRAISEQADGITIETQHRTKSGDLRDVLVSGRRVEIDDRVLVYGIWIDTTERKQSKDRQQRLSTILEASSDFIGYATLNGQTVFVNRAGRELVGLDEDQVMQTALIDCFLPRDQAYVQAEILPIVLREGYWKGDFRFRHFKTGATVPVGCHLFLVKDPNTGAPTGIATISRDIRDRLRVETERLQFKAEREQAASELAEANVQLEHRNRELSILNEELEVALEEVQVAEEELSEQNAELRQAQTALRDALQRLTFHVENSPLAVVEWNHDFRVSRWSSEAERIFGWRAEEVIGRGFGDWQFVHEADLERVQRAAAGLTNGTEQQVVMHNRNYTKSGEVVHCEWYSSALVDRSGRLVSVLSLALDVSDRVQFQNQIRESEARYRALSEAIPQLVWVTTADGENEYVNQQFCDFVGLTQAQLSNSGWLSIIHPDDRDRTRDRWLAAVTSGSFYEIEYRFRRFDGTYRWFLGQGVPFKDGSGQVVKWFGTCTDIDAQKQNEAVRLQLIEQERTAREAAEQANRIKDEFLAVVSHELRTPLNPILGWSRLLRSGKLAPDRAAEALSTIERNAQQQAQLINDLLDVSRILRNKLTLTLEPVDLATIVTNALETVRFAAEAKSIQLSASLAASWSTMLGDASRLQQIVWNLLSNAVKFTPEGGRIEVRLMQDGSYAQLQVIDTGKGIAPQFLPHLFEAFRQEDNTTTRKFGGLGLGLSIVQQLVELHGGTVTAESCGVEQGSTFTVRLPILSHPLDRSTPAIVDQNANLSGIRVLVVDDVTDSREFIAFVLEQAGASVIAASSAAAALELLSQTTLDVMVSDVGMPEFNGYELIQQIRQSATSIRAIALTAYATEDDQQQALNAGFDRHLAKPIDPAILIQAVASLIRS